MPLEDWDRDAAPTGQPAHYDTGPAIAEAERVREAIADLQAEAAGQQGPAPTPPADTPLDPELGQRVDTAVDAVGGLAHALVGIDTASIRTTAEAQADGPVAAAAAAVGGVTLTTIDLTDFYLDARSDSFRQTRLVEVFNAIHAAVGAGLDVAICELAGPESPTLDGVHGDTLLIMTRDGSAERLACLAHLRHCRHVARSAGAVFPGDVTSDGSRHLGRAVNLPGRRSEPYRQPVVADRSDVVLSKILDQLRTLNATTAALSAKVSAH